VAFHELAERTRVSISGLRSAAHQNGKLGRVLAYDPERLRYTVQLDDAADKGGAAGGQRGESLSVRVENLHAVVDAELTELASSPELNGTRGTLLSYEPDKDRYHVRLHDGRVAALAAANLVLPAETRCTVVGLASAAAQQHTSALFMLAEFLIEGNGCTADEARAVPLLHAAAERGHRMARQYIRDYLDLDARQNAATASVSVRARAQVHAERLPSLPSGGSEHFCIFRGSTGEKASAFAH
jgi:TPR repeat protein